MTDTVMLTEKVKNSPLKIGYIASYCQLSRSGFRNKLKGKYPFNQREIIALSDILNLNTQEREQIFFALNGQ
jgi:hypothetical protein